MYITEINMISLLGESIASQLTDDQLGTYVNTSFLTDIITNQTALMDNYLRGRYTLPLSNSHYILTNICFILTKYELYKRRNAVTDRMQAEHLEAMKQLNDLRKGLIILDETNVSLFSASELDTVFTNEL
jgi:phage gp36-like protein